jgi:hypothetical protein
MSKQTEQRQYLSELIDALFRALDASAEYQCLRDGLPTVGLENRIEIKLHLFDLPSPEGLASSQFVEIKDSDFLKGLRIDPNITPEGKD